MKKTFLLSAALLVIICSAWHRTISSPAEQGTLECSGAHENQSGHFVLKGKITGQSSGVMHLSYSADDGSRKSDSSIIKNGEFRFEGNLASPVMVSIVGAVKSFSMDDPNTTGFYLEPGTVTFTAKVNDFKNARITGSKTQDEYMVLQKSLAPIMNEIKPLNKEYEQVNSDYAKAIRDKKDEKTLEDMKNKAAAVHDKFDPFHERSAKLTYDFFRKYPQSYVTAFELRFYVNDMSVDTLQLYYDRLGPVVQQGASGKEVAKQLEHLRWGSPGSVAKDFSTTDINGDKISLSDFKGKYVLLDFWASWCVPCRRGNPHLKELYSRYKVKGIEFIGVSDDDWKPEEWKKAVAKDGLPWRHVLRGLDEEKMRKNEPSINDISEKFGIHSLPTKILIDPDGKVIGRYSSEEGPLDAMLTKIFGS